MTVERAPAFQFYVKEWRSSRPVMRMTFAQRGMYLEMLLEQWENMSLPDDPEAVAELIGGSVEEWTANWPVLRRNFLTDEATGRIKNTRLEQCRKDRRQYEKRSRQQLTRQRQAGLARAASAMRREDGTYLPASEPAGAPGCPAPSSASATASASPKEVPPSEVSAAAPVRAASPTFLTFPTIGTGPKTWALTEAHCAEWGSAYPGLDVRGECQRALVWVKANRPKTAKGMPAFLVRWMNNAVNRNGGRSVPASSVKTAGNVSALQRFIDRGSQ